MKLWPTRQKYTPQVVADLDAMVSEPFAFKLHGKQRIIKPIQLEEFLKYTNAYAMLWNKAEDGTKKLSDEKLLDIYVALFTSVCDDITKDDIRKMSQAQIGALFQLISDAVTGKAHVDQKKTLQNAMMTGTMASQL